MTPYRLAFLICLGIFAATAAFGQETPPADGPNPSESPAATSEDGPPGESAPAESPAAEETEEAQLPRAADVPLPSAEELLAGPRRDWVVLKDGRLLVVEPVFPRPDTLEKMQAERNAILDDANRRASPAGKARLDQLLRLGVFLPDEGVSAEYRIRLDNIERIVHHEELMLQRVDRLVDEGDALKAFELLFVVARTDPNWPGLDERQVRVTLVEASRLIEADAGERAMTLLEPLYERKPPPDGAAALLGRAADLLVGSPTEAEDYRRARAALSRVRAVDSGHPAVEKWAGRLAGIARSLRDEAERVATAGDEATAAGLVETAARAWPTLGGLKQTHARLTRRYQRLTVGVPGVAPATPGAVGSLRDERVSRLAAADLFEVDAFEALPSFRSVYFERWEPTDLGRRARFSLRPALPAWAARPALTASEVTALLGERLRPGGPAFDARFADLVRALRPLGPYEFEVVFSRPPLRTESALARPPAFGGDDAAALLRRFVEAERSDGRVAYRRAVPERSDDRHLAEVVEVGFPSYEKAAQALDRGEVRMLAEVPAWDAPRLAADKRFVVTRLAVPVTHVLQFHPASAPLKSTELRRALASSADAAAMLRTLTGVQKEEVGRLVTAPYPSTHRGYDPIVEPRVADLPLALALTLASEKAFGGSLPELVFAAPAEQPGRGLAETLARTWKRVGLPVRLVTFDELGPDGRWDVAYRELTVPDPAAALAPLITLDPTGDVARLADLPDWLRQRLLDLERAGDAATAEEILIDLHRLLYADVRCVPLFEIDRFTAARGVIEGLPERPVTVYHNAERWTVLPDYPEERP